MRIFYIGQKGLPAVSGGVERHVEQLSTSMVKHGHEVYVYTRKSYNTQGLKEYKGVNLINLPSIATKNLDAISHTFLACLNLVFKRNVDVVHFHSIGPSSLIWIIKLFRPSIPVVATFHSKCYLHRKWGFLARMYLKLSERLVCALPDFTITISPDLKEYVDKKYKAASKYFPNVSEVKDKKEADIIKKWGLEKDGYILSVSRLVKIKGLKHLIKAFKKSDIDKKLIITGEGDYDGYADELKSLAGGDSRIIFTGTQSGDALCELYSNAYLFVQSSEREGMSMALLEAMSYGCGVLVSDIPENINVVKEAGFSFKSKDADNLALKLQELDRRKDLVKQKGAEAKTLVENNYNLDNLSLDMSAFYNNLKAEKIAHKKGLFGAIKHFLFLK